MSAHLKLVAPNIVNRQVAPGRKPNAELRTREHLTPAEVEKLIKAAKAGRHGHRDATMVLVAYRHGLRAAELCDLRWEQVDMGRNACLHVRRVKGGTPALTQFRVMSCAHCVSYAASIPTAITFFAANAAGPFTEDGYNRQIKRIGTAAKLPFPIHSHMLRHACGYALANKGHDTRRLQAYLGHKNIQHTVRYTALSPAPFKDFWRD